MKELSGSQNMAFDGIFMSHICRELQAAVGSRIEKIYQPSRDDIVLTVSGKGFSRRLLITVSGVGPRVHFTDQKFENPATPPMFCMLMRKHFQSARLESVRQNGLDRVLLLEFSAFNELGDSVELTIAVEIMGRQSNVILVCDGRILDALKRVSLESGGRLILPGAKYELPETQGKANVSAVSSGEFDELVSTAEPAKTLCTALEGVSPLVAREVCLAAENGGSAAAHAMLLSYKERGVPTLVVDPSGEPKDFTYMPIRQYDGTCTCEEYEDFSALCDRYFSRLQHAAAIRRRTHELVKLVSTLIERTSRKIEKQRGELAATENRERCRIFGELLKANIYRIERGASFVDVSNYYDPDCATVRIPLKPELTAAENAQRYFTEYRKLNTARQLLERFIAESIAELNYLESVLDILSRAESERELGEIRAELADAGYIKVQRGRSKPPKSLGPLHFVSDDGFDIYVGRNNRQNDELTLKLAAKSDIWLHTKGVHGTHTVISACGKEVPPSTVLQAANLAAYHSKARQSSSVAVDYCPVKNVKKPSGARPGMVIYDVYETVYVTPDESLVDRLKVDVQ